MLTGLAADIDNSAVSFEEGEEILANVERPEEIHVHLKTRQKEKENQREMRQREKERIKGK